LGAGAVAGLLVALTSSAAFADDVDEPTEWPRPSTDLTVLPQGGGDSDIGIGGGALLDIARVKPRLRPYAWRLEGGVFLAAKPREGTVRVTYQDYYLQWTAPHVVTNRLRLVVRPSFTSEPTQKYFGLGNDSPDSRDGFDYSTSPRYFEYSRIRASVLVALRVRLAGYLHVQVAQSFTHNWIDARAESSLATDLAQGSPKVKELLGGTTPHGVARFDYGLVWDSRDDEIWPTSGGFHQTKLRLSPGGSEEFPYRYGQFNATGRFYVTPIRSLTIAVRLVADLLFGSPPFYELARFEDSFAFGGTNGVRGVPAQRFYGKIKAFGNVEARLRVAQFSMLGKASRLALVAFADGGRLWADYSGGQALDGSALGLKYGLGGGFRLQQGATFLMRADVAWSPDARPIGVYIDANQAF